MSGAGAGGAAPGGSPAPPAAAADGLVDVFAFKPAARAYYDERAADGSSATTLGYALYGGPPPDPADGYALPGEPLACAHARHGAAAAVGGGLDAFVARLLDGAYGDVYARVTAAVRAPLLPGSSLLPGVLLSSPGTVTDGELVLPGLVRALRRDTPLVVRVGPEAVRTADAMWRAALGGLLRADASARAAAAVRALKAAASSASTGYSQQQQQQEQQLSALQAQLRARLLDEARRAYDPAAPGNAGVRPHEIARRWYGDRRAALVAAAATAAGSSSSSSNDAAALGGGLADRVVIVLDDATSVEPAVLSDFIRSAHALVTPTQPAAVAARPPPASGASPVPSRPSSPAIPAFGDAAGSSSSAAGAASSSGSGWWWPGSFKDGPVAPTAAAAPGAPPSPAAASPQHAPTAPPLAPPTWDGAVPVALVLATATTRETFHGRLPLAAARLLALRPVHLPHGIKLLHELTDSLLIGGGWPLRLGPSSLGFLWDACVDYHGSLRWATQVLSWAGQHHFSGRGAAALAGTAATAVGSVGHPTAGGSAAAPGASPPASPAAGAGAGAGSSSSAAAPAPQAVTPAVAAARAALIAQPFEVWAALLVERQRAQRRAGKAAPAPTGTAAAVPGSPAWLRRSPLWRVITRFVAWLPAGDVELLLALPSVQGALAACARRRGLPFGGTGSGSSGIADALLVEDGDDNADGGDDDGGAEDDADADDGGSSVVTGTVVGGRGGGAGAGSSSSAPKRGGAAAAPAKVGAGAGGPSPSPAPAPAARGRKRGSRQLASLETWSYHWKSISQVKEARRAAMEDDGVLGMPARAVPLARGADGGGTADAGPSSSRRLKQVRLGEAVDGVFDPVGPDGWDVAGSGPVPLPAAGRAYLARRLLALTEHRLAWLPAAAVLFTAVFGKSVWARQAAAAAATTTTVAASATGGGASSPAGAGAGSSSSAAAAGEAFSVAGADGTATSTTAPFAPSGPSSGLPPLADSVRDLYHLTARTALSGCPGELLDKARGAVRGMGLAQLTGVVRDGLAILEAGIPAPVAAAVVSADGAASPAASPPPSPCAPSAAAAGGVVRLPHAWARVHPPSVAFRPLIRAGRSVLAQLAAAAMEASAPAPSPSAAASSSSSSASAALLAGVAGKGSGVLQRKALKTSLASAVKAHPLAGPREAVAGWLTSVADRHLTPPQSLPLAEGVVFTASGALRRLWAPSPRGAVSGALDAPEAHLGPAAAGHADDDGASLSPAMPPAALLSAVVQALARAGGGGGDDSGDEGGAEGDAEEGGEDGSDLAPRPLRRGGKRKGSGRKGKGAAAAGGGSSGTRVKRRNLPVQELYEAYRAVHGEALRAAVAAEDAAAAAEEDEDDEEEDEDDKEDGDVPPSSRKRGRKAAASASKRRKRAADAGIDVAAGVDGAQAGPLAAAEAAVAAGFTQALAELVAVGYLRPSRRGRGAGAGDVVELVYGTGVEW